MIWSARQTQLFRDMYASGATYVEIAIATDKTVQDIRDIYHSEKRSGNMKRLNDKRLKAKIMMRQEPIIEIIHENGRDIPRHRAGYAKGISPQVTAKI